MSDTPQNPGGFSADIPQDAIDAALRSVDKSTVTTDPPGAAGEEKPDRVRQLEAMLEESTGRAAQTQERLKETHDRYLRTAADFENWKKRNAKEKEETVKFANERLLKEFLPIADNLERALQSAGTDSSTLTNGVRLVLKQMNDALARFGVKSFTTVGEPFDPARHEALMHQESDAPPNTVIHEMSKGYLLNDRLIRPAAVVVAKAKAPATSETQGSSGSDATPPGDLPN